MLPFSQIQFCFKIGFGRTKMKNLIKSTLFILTLATLMVSCSHQTPKESTQSSQERSVASKSCWDSVKGEYQSYFDSVEKCIEKESDK